MKTITIGLPMPPSTNNLYFNRRTGGRAITARYSTWREAAGWEIQATRPGKIPGQVVLSIALQKPAKRKADCSNYIKAIEDLLVTHGVIDDDSNVEAVAVRWSKFATGAEVTIAPALENVLSGFGKLELAA